jgi:hypothetical protein
MAGLQIPFIKEIKYQPARFGLRWVDELKEIPNFDWTRGVLSPYYYLSPDPFPRQIQAQQKLLKEGMQKNLGHLEFPRLVRASPHFDLGDETPSGKLVSDSKLRPVAEIGLFAKDKHLLKAFGNLWQCLWEFDIQFDDDRDNFMEKVREFAENYGILHPQPLVIRFGAGQYGHNVLGTLGEGDSFDNWREAVCEVKFWQIVLKHVKDFADDSKIMLWSSEFWKLTREKVDYSHSDDFTQEVIDRLVLNAMQAIDGVAPVLTTRRGKRATPEEKKKNRVAPGLEIAAIAENYLLYTFSTNSNERLLYRDGNLIARVGVLDWARYELAVLYTGLNELRPCARDTCGRLFMPNDDRFEYCSRECRDKAKYSRRHEKEKAAKRASKTAS